MASAYLQSKSANLASTSSPAVTLTNPPVSGHVLVAFIFTGGAETTIDISGWNKGTQQSNANVAGRSFWKVSDGTEQTVTGSITTARPVSITVLEYSGVNPSAPELAENSSANAAGTRITGSITPASSKTGMLVGLRGVKTNSTASGETLVTTNVGTVNEREDSPNATNGSIAAWDAPVTSTSGNYSGAWTDSSGAANVGAIVALLDASLLTGAAAEPVIVSFVAAGIRKALGAAARGETFTITAAGTRKTFGAAARPQTFTITATGVRKTLGAAARSQTFTIHAAGVRKTLGAATRPQTLTITAAGVRKALGTVARPIVIAFTAAGIVTPGGGGTFGAGTAGFLSSVSRGDIAKSSAGEFAGASLGGVS